MGLMTQKDMAQQGSERINAFLDKSKEDSIQKEFDEDAMQMSDRQAEYESNQWKNDPSKQEPGLISPIDSVLEFTGVSALGSAFDSVGSALEGDYAGASIDGLATLLGTVPLVGSKLKKPLKDALGANKIAVERGDIGVSEALMGGTFLKQYGKDVISRMDTLAVNASVKNGSGKMFQPVADGTRVGVRLNLNSVVPDAPKGLDKLQTVHEKSFDGKVLSYQPYATVTDVTFKVSPAKRRNIAAKIKGLKVKEVEHKNPAMSVNGLLSPKENVVIKGGKDVTEIGFNPMNNHLFIDMKTGQAVKTADVATVIGDRVYARGVKYWKKSEAPAPWDASDGTPLPSEVRYKFNQGGLVDNEMQALNFNHGGVVHGKVGASNVGADMLAKLIAQNKQGDFKRGDAREGARVAQPIPTQDDRPIPTQDDRPTPSYDDRPALDAAVIKMVEDHKRKQVVQAEEFSEPQQSFLNYKLSNLAEAGGDVLSEAVDSGIGIAKKVYRKGRDAYNNLTAEVDEEMARLQADTTPTKISQEAVPPIVTDHRGKAALERGVRNNNPLNIKKKVSNAWDGIAEDQSGDSIFATFESAEYGIRAALRTLVTYQNKHKLRTPSEMLARWAPPSENIVSDYVATVKDLSGLSMDDPMVIGNNQKTLDLIRSMVAMENSQKAMRGYSSNTYNRALQLAFPTPKIRDDEPLPKERKQDRTNYAEIIK